MPQIKVLLLAVKDFNPDCGDSAYTMSIVDLLLECVELSYRPGNSLTFSSCSQCPHVIIEGLKCPLKLLGHRSVVLQTILPENNPLGPLSVHSLIFVSVCC